ncbi:MAG: M56 family metallopeptidase, partial [Planctomycetota bacterium]|nr:M56 family metallopeptidase [Planctomycetota bacterium]
MPSTFVLAMSEPVAAWLVRTSWQALVLVAIVAGVQLLFGKLLSPRWRYALWMLVVVRLLMPVAPSSPWSVFNVPLPQVRGEAADRVNGSAKPQAADGVTIRIVKTFDADVKPAAVQPVQAVLAPQPFDWRRLLLAVWLAGSVLLVLRFVIAHALLTRRLRGAPPVDADLRALLDDCRRAMRVRGNVRIIATDAVGGPALFGFFRPKLLVPPAMLRDLDRDDLRFVFLHELAHLKRRDTLLNIPLSLAAALHWFNPAVWFALSRCRTERELACDAMVLEVTDSPRAQQGYGQTMLRLAEALCAPGGNGRRPRAVPAALGILQTRSQLNRRITMISAFRRSSSSRRWSLLPAVLLVGVASCALTDKASSEGPATRPAAAAANTGAAPAPNDRDSAGLTAAEALLKGVAPTPDATPGVDVDTARVNQALDRRIADLNLDAKPFSDVVEQLRGMCDLDIFVNWRALESEGIDRSAPVTARLRNAKFSKALQVILDDVGGGTVALGCSIDDGTITITSKADLNRNTVTRVYDIRDLIADVPDYAPAGGAPPHPKPQPTTQSGPSQTEQIISLIQETVDPDAWREAGGSVGAIRELSGQLIVTATPEMHDGIGKLFHQIREARGVQLTVEARFIAITPALLDKALGGKLRGTLAKSSEPTVWQLSDAQVDAVLREAQQAESASLITAPRITLFNGQRGYVVVSTQTAY